MFFFLGGVLFFFPVPLAICDQLIDLFIVYLLLFLLFHLLQHDFRLGLSSSFIEIDVYKYLTVFHLHYHHSYSYPTSPLFISIVRGYGEGWGSFKTVRGYGQGGGRLK